MKQALSIRILLLLFFTMTKSSYAQAAEGNVFIITTFERAMPQDGTARELDSLNQIFVDNSYKNNPSVISYKTLRHWWGHDNRDLVQIVEVKDWDAVEAANEKAGELFREAMPNKADRDKFNKAYSKYFTGKHSDEIYREVVFNK